MDMELQKDPVSEGRRMLALGAAGTSTATQEEQPLPLRCALRALLACAWRTAVLIAQRRIRQPAGNVGRRVQFADGTAAEVYRETVIDHPPPREPAVLVVCFRLRWIRSGWSHALFRLESELNTVLFAGFEGLVSNLWLAHDKRGIYRGFYQWDGTDEAVAYVRALWWVLALVSEPASVHHAVLPGLERDEVLRDPTMIDTVAAAPGGWWRPSGTPAGAS
jgi:hypothetical protein